jgi:hypothetical protein
MSSDVDHDAAARRLLTAFVGDALTIDDELDEDLDVATVIGPEIEPSAYDLLMILASMTIHARGAVLEWARHADATPQEVVQAMFNSSVEDDDGE